MSKGSSAVILPSVVIADQHLSIAQSLEAVLGDLGGAQVAALATSAIETIAVSRKLAPDVAIVDLELSPDCSLVTGLRESCPDTRIIVMVDRDTNPGDRLLKALESGAVGAVYKGASLDEFGRALAASSDESPFIPSDASGLLLNSYLEAMADKRRRDLATIEALAGAVEVRDMATGQHLHRVTKLAEACLERIDPELARNEEVSFGFMLHDIGKIGVPDAILQKPGPLTGEEWSVMRQHPEMGVRIVEPMGFSETAVNIILSHHERWDGDGYPNRLTGDEIPLTARAFSVVDAFDAMTSDRPYRTAMGRDEALGTISYLAGAAFDPDVVDTFTSLIEDDAVAV